MQSRNYNFDKELEFKDAGAVTSTGVTSVDSVTVASKTVGNGRFEAVMLFDVSAIKISAGNEKYELVIEGSNDGFTTQQVLGLASLGATAARPGGAIDSVIGRHEVPFHNEINGVIYKDIRVRHIVNGTSPSIDYKAYASTKY